MGGMTGRIALAMLVLLPLAAGADEDQVEKQLLEQVYAGGGSTLYCQKAFKPGDRVKLDFIYRERQMMDHFNCITTRQCLGKPDFQRAFNDLHNVYPVLRTVELDRRRTLFGDLPDDVAPAEDNCDYRLSFQTFSPPDKAKGNVARAMLYMHQQHKLPLIGPLEMHQRWNRLDPPDEAEKARNNAIARIIGTRNPFIDNADAAEELEGGPRRNFQFR